MNYPVQSDSNYEHEYGEVIACTRLSAVQCIQTRPAIFLSIINGHVLSAPCTLRYRPSHVPNYSPYE
jgi:hypothetical protein